MPVITLNSAEEFEDKGHADVEFVGFRYTGDRSVKTDQDIRQRAGYDGPPKFQQGRVYFGILPTNLDPEHVDNASMGVHALEARSDFEVLYDPERLSEALLERNYLPPDVFYEGFDRWKRAKVMAKLDLDDAGRVYDKDDEAPYREQLRAISGVEADDEASVSQQRSDEYVDRFSRAEASDIVKVVRQDPDEIDLRTAGLTDMAEYLTRFTPDTVEDAIDAALGEDDPDDVTITRVDDTTDDGSDDSDTDSDEE
ncbi:hypothetical protein NDI85_21155 [Halomicroarcula sp. S1AR25-4]|uniref:hypothetical protein n=1 Tax=Haloarcula sp. S1AR25-4 TaxID=2950538 RepID=UPI002874D8A8|nr:hypothetical protein [Halomicroarcula sp. S1AR25-4]MDS0280296.1 hypothetical protein [Halomicroarcula sp. S1AR25-4]